ARALAALAPARLLDELQQLVARLVAAPALGESVGVGEAQPLVLRQQAHGAGQQAETRVRLGRLARPRDQQRLVARVVAALGEGAGQRLPRLGLAVERDQPLAQR